MPTLTQGGAGQLVQQDQGWEPVLFKAWHVFCPQLKDVVVPGSYQIPEVFFVPNRRRWSGVTDRQMTGAPVIY